MKAIKRLRAARREKGAVAIVVGLAMVMLMTAAALGVDISKLVYERQQLRNALDAAAAAGAQQLPGDPDQAISDAKNFAAANNAGVVPSVSLRCVVGYNSSTASPDWVTVASQCGITNKVFDAANCNTFICSIPCTVDDSCNTIVVSANKTVDYTFGPAIGIPTGRTGAITSAACRGSCGTIVPNPMNVVVMADRTASMDSADITQMKTGINNMLKTMTRTQQYVAFGAIHKSLNRNSCVTSVPKNGAGTGLDKAFVTVDGYKTLAGTWVPTQFSNSYTTGSADDGNLAVNSADSVVKAVTCMEDYGGEKNAGTYTYPSDASTGLGTHLASAMKGAARYLLGKGGGNNIAALDLAGTRTNLGTPKNVIILETDGRPEELWTSNNVAKSLDNVYDIASTDGGTSCQNLIDIAKMAKDAGILVITIGYGDVNTFKCVGTTTTVKSVLAKAASPLANGTASVAGDCGNATNISKENMDGDWYFCAADGADLASVFRTAMGSITGHGKLMALPGIA
jgi:Flp pilus assembly protein TadG